VCVLPRLTGCGETPTKKGMSETRPTQEVERRCLNPPTRDRDRRYTQWHREVLYLNAANWSQTRLVAEGLRRRRTAFRPRAKLPTDLPGAAPEGCGPTYCRAILRVFQPTNSIRASKVVPARVWLTAPPSRNECIE